MNKEIRIQYQKIMYRKRLSLLSTEPQNNILELQQNTIKIYHKMGNCASIKRGLQRKKSQQALIVATLNYGGILNSPFEFYSNQQSEEKLLSQHFKDLIPEYYKDFDQKNFSWKIGKIDQKIQKERYTPIYSATAGVENGKHISAQRFKQKWDQNFGKALPKAKLQKNPTEEEIECMRTFDLACYHALLRHVYKIKSITEVQDKNAEEYSKLMEKFFSRSYLDEGKKLKLLQNLLQDENQMVDVFFIQEPTQALVDCLKKEKKFKLFEGTKDNSIIALRNNTQTEKNALSFDEIKKTAKISPQSAQKVQANPQTRIVFSNKLIFICVHLSSKPEKNKKELEELKEGINILMKAFPNYDFVIGGDTNAFIKQDQIQDEKTLKKIHIYPDNPRQITTCKTRTCMQPQFNKANKMAEECKDQFMTTLEVEDYKIITIDKQFHEKAINLPTESHPFDHMLVYASFNLPKSENK